jgi:hypothetical protein
MRVEHRSVSGPDLANKVICEFYRCEMHNTCHLSVTDEFLHWLRLVFAQAGVQLELKQIPNRELKVDHDRPHQVLEVLMAVHEVQGLKWDDGVSPLLAIESLVAKYAALR